MKRALDDGALSRIARAMTAQEEPSQSENWVVKSVHPDERQEHTIGEGSSYEEARQIADDWLGPNAEWQSDDSAISMYGDILTIENQPLKLTEFEDKVWGWVNQFWSGDAAEIFESLRRRDLTDEGSIAEIDDALDTLVEGGYITKKFLRSEG